MAYKTSKITGDEFTKDEYDALTAANARAQGFLTHPNVVYEKYEDKIADKHGVKKITLDSTTKAQYDAGTIIPAGTKFNELEEAHFNF